MDTSLTPLLAMKSSALLTLAILWNLILPRSGMWEGENIHQKCLQNKFFATQITPPPLQQKARLFRWKVFYCSFVTWISSWKEKLSEKHLIPPTTDLFAVINLLNYK